jgi:hypothetical protein
LRNDAKLASKVNAIMDDHRKAIERLTGADKYKQFRQYIITEKGKQAESLLSLNLKNPEGLGIFPEDTRRLQVQRQEASQAFLRRLGIAVEKIHAVNKSTRTKLKRLVSPTPTKDGKPVILILQDSVPSDIRAGKTNPWEIKTPPYPGWAWDYSGYVAGFSFEPTLYLDSPSGLVGNNNYLWDSSASDFDYGFVGYNTAVGFWYKMPKAGLVEVWIKAQCAHNLHYCALYDEWGWSDSSVYQRDYLTMKATSPSSDVLSMSQMSWWYEDGYNSGFWSNHYLTEGSTYWAHLYSDVSFQKDAWVYVLVGTRTWNYCFANDVEVYSDAKFKWFIQAVYVRSTG